jgi:hypothetical protein
MTADVLRRRVEHDVGAELERPLEVGRGERVVDDDDRADLVRRVGGRADVDDVQHRVRRRLEPDDPCPLVQVRGEVRVDLLGRDEVEGVSLRLVDLREHPVDAAVDIVDADDSLAGVDEVHERRRRADPGRESRTVLRPLERGEHRLERGPRRVGDP